MPPALLVRRQYQLFIDRPPAVVFGFRADLANHGRTAPAGQKEEVVHGAEAPLGPGARIGFRTRQGPFGLLVTTLETEVVEWDPPHGFVIRQVRGPFAAFHHAQSFPPFQQGTLLTDRIDYRVPLGPLGWLADRLWLGPLLDQTFAHRQKAAKQLLEQGPKRLFKGGDPAAPAAGAARSDEGA
jgi:ligand-binding SRPBCC domain-containing protein